MVKITWFVIILIFNVRNLNLVSLPALPPLPADNRIGNNFLQSRKPPFQPESPPPSSPFPSPSTSRCPTLCPPWPGISAGSSSSHLCGHSWKVLKMTLMTAGNCMSQKNKYPDGKTIHWNILNKRQLGGLKESGESDSMSGWGDFMAGEDEGSRRTSLTQPKIGRKENWSAFFPLSL